MINFKKRNNLKSDILTTTDKNGRVVLIEKVADGIQIKSNDFVLCLTQENLKDLSEYGGKHDK